MISYLLQGTLAGTVQLRQRAYHEWSAFVGTSVMPRTAWRFARDIKMSCDARTCTSNYEDNAEEHEHAKVVRKGLRRG